MDVRLSGVLRTIELQTQRPAHYQRLLEARPIRNATTNAAKGACRTTLLKVSRALPGFLPSSIASLMVVAADLTPSVRVDVISDNCSLAVGACSSVMFASLRKKPVRCAQE
jgi:hypothetical protein